MMQRARPPASIRILLLQARRPDDPAKAEEVLSFATYSGVEPEQIVSHDLLGGPPTLAHLRRFDALMVGGSGEYYVSRGNLPQFPRLLDFLSEVVGRAHPTFASCFGFQCLVAALGGEILHDVDGMELGTYELELTDEGRRDELFGDLPKSFRAQLGRKDRAARPFVGVRRLARSAASPIQALRVPGKPIWATQFHPELDRVTNLGRYERYLDGYARILGPEAQAEALRRFEESPEANRLPRRFLDLVFG